MSTAAPPLNDLVGKIRDMHPGSYDDMDDATLTKRVLAKYPQYSDLAAPKIQPPAPPIELDPRVPSEEQANKEASEYAGRAGTMMMGGGIAKLGGEAMPAIKGAVGSIARAASDVVDPEITGVFSPRLGNAQRVAGRLGKALEPKPVYPGAHLPEAPPVYPGAPLPEHPGVFTGAPLPEHPGVFTGAPLPEHPGVFTGAPLPETPSQELLQGNALGRAPARPPSGSVALRGIRSIPVPPEEPPVFPGAPLPQAPPPEVSQARGLATGGRNVPEPSSALGKIPPPVPEGPAPIAVQPKGVVSKQLDTGLREAVGNRPVQPGIKIRDQFKPTAPAVNVPEGHAAVESSAVKSFKYDPAAKELHITSKDGTTHVYGEVTPAQAEAFGTADSKGAAWKAIRDNNVRVAKILPNGVRTASKGASDFKSASPEDLTPILKESLKQAKKPASP